jgi:hypothetical protein
MSFFFFAFLVCLPLSIYFVPIPSVISHLLSSTVELSSIHLLVCLLIHQHSDLFVFQRTPQSHLRVKTLHSAHFEPTFHLALHPVFQPTYPCVRHPLYDLTAASYQKSFVRRDLRRKSPPFSIDPRSSASPLPDIGLPANPTIYLDLHFAQRVST